VVFGTPAAGILLVFFFLSLTFSMMSFFSDWSGQTVCVGGPERPCYKIAYFHDVSSRVAFREAVQACEMDGGALLSIESPGEQRDIEHLLSGAVGGPGSGGGISDGDFWIGLTRVDGADQTETSHAFTSCPQMYYWTDGSPAPFRNWYFDEPSCGGEACVVMYHQPTAIPGLGGAYLYQWNDDRCNMKHNFICKYEPGTVSQSGGRGCLGIPPLEEMEALTVFQWTWCGLFRPGVVCLDLVWSVWTWCGLFGPGVVCLDLVWSVWTWCGLFGPGVVCLDLVWSV
uniref:Chondrolectin n=1 Tax=Sphaeramia orbicularis TaxID=375764 RepID=A0A673BIG0_9TELE